MFFPPSPFHGSCCKQRAAPHKQASRASSPYLPVVIAGFFGGTLIDRLGYKRTSIIADLASGVTTAMIPLLHFTIGLEFWQLMVLVFLGALLDTPGGTARAALLPELAEQAGMPIERATSLTHVIERGARLVGAPLAGLLIGIMGTENVLWLDAASFFISAGIIWIVISGQKPVEKERKSTGYFDELRDGLRFIAHDKLILAIVIMVMLTNFLDCDLWRRGTSRLCKRGLRKRHRFGIADRRKRGRRSHRRIDLRGHRSSPAASCRLCGGLCLHGLAILGLSPLSPDCGFGHYWS